MNLTQPQAPRLLGNIPNVDFAWCASNIRVPLVGANASPGSFAVATVGPTVQGLAAKSGYLRVNAIVPSMYLTTWTEFGVVLLDAANNVGTLSARNEGQTILFQPGSNKIDLVIWGVVDVNISGTLPTGVVHYAIRRNGSAHSVWLNGKLQGTASVANTPAASTGVLPSIGSDAGSGGSEGGTPLVATNGILSIIRTPTVMGDEFCREASRNHWQLYAPLRSSVLFAPPAGGGTTVALTGVSGTGSVGSLAASVSIALTGNAATGSVGSLTPSTGVVIALTGNEGTGSVGSLAPSVSIALSGNAVTGSVGDLTPVSGVIVALTGNSATGSVGSLAPSISIALTGNQAIGSVGSMSVLGADATVTPGQSFFELAEQSRRWREDDEPEAQPPEVIEAVKQDYERKSAVLVTILDDLQAESNDIRERIAVLEKRKSDKAERELTERKQLLAMAEVKRAIVLEEMEVMDVAYVAAAVLTLQ